MEYVFETLMELIITPIVEGYAFAMMHFWNKKVVLTKDKIKIIVVFECIILLVLFLVGVIMLFETLGDSFLGKLFVFVSSSISLCQIIVGYILKKNTVSKDK